MNRNLLFMLLALCVMLISSGCASMSLCSDRHVHYHGSEETDNKVDLLEKRINALEQAANQK